MDTGESDDEPGESEENDQSGEDKHQNGMNRITRDEQIDENPVKEHLIEPILSERASSQQHETTPADDESTKPDEVATDASISGVSNEIEPREDEYVFVLEENEVEKRTDISVNLGVNPVEESPIVQQVIIRDQVTENEEMANTQTRSISNDQPQMTPQPYDNVLSEFKNLQMSRKPGSPLRSPTPTQPQVQTQQFNQQPQILTSRINPQHSSIYNRNPPSRRQDFPQWYTPPNRPLPPTPLQQQDVINNQSYNQYARDQTSPIQTPTSPISKLSTNTPYVGSHVIATETGPSLTVLLRRHNSERQWGFTFYGGSEYGCPPFVNKVSKNSLASQNGVEVGDVIVSICKALTVGKSSDQLKAEILRAGNELDLILIRQGVDLLKITQIVPRVLSHSVCSSPSNVTFASPLITTPDANTQRVNPSSGRGRSFRTVKTKSLKMLEEQLSSGQNPSSSILTKQHFQGARGLSASGAASSFTKAYGQSELQGYAGRTAPIQSINISQQNMAPSSHEQPNYNCGDRHFFDQDMVQWVQPVSMGPNWETQSEMGNNWNRRQDAYMATQPSYQPTFMNPTMSKEAHQARPAQFSAQLGPNRPM